MLKKIKIVQFEELNHEFMCMKSKL